MRTYEMTYITVDEQSAKADAVRALLEEHKATITSVNTWDGRRRLAYPIKKQDQGFYTTVVFEAEAAQVAGIERDLRLNNTVIRSLIVLFEPGIFQRGSDPVRSVSRVISKETPTEESVAEVQPETTKTVSPVEVTEPEEVKEPPKKKRASRKSAEEVKELEAKLDELLNEDLTK